MDEKTIRKDRMRYTKNTTSSSFALLAILFNVFYFVSIYRSDVGSYYYTWLTGASIIYNLVFMLVVFLCSEGVKLYNFNYSVTMIIVGALQIVRIFIIPRKAATTILQVGEEERAAMLAPQHVRVICFLLISSAFLIVGGIIGIIKGETLRAYQKSLENKAA
ncbi:MAG: hypothetical protein J6113_00205 [Lachnospiraceae bacterium]|nr:hypothetical protein [Lachnospiraceae bacterium]